MDPTSNSLLPSASPSATPSPLPDLPPSTGNGLHPAVSFLIGALIILGASAMNAGGLNITKLDHVRTASLPRSSRRPPYLRPLWILGMALYIISQLLGSTLALQYLRAEYVAPLGATSLIFNFLFASWLVGTPVTQTDIRGTITVITGVIGIVVFGSLHSPSLSDYVDLPRLQHLWARAAWWGFFLLMALGIFFTYCWSSMLQRALAQREELELPLHSSKPSHPAWLERGWLRPLGVLWSKMGEAWASVQAKVDRLAEASDDKFLSWVLAMGWSCCGGALAGGCLVFAKAVVGLLSSGSSFLSPAAILTLLLLLTTAVTQIVCLNRALEAWDSTLVVPVFYGIYTCSGFLDSLVFYEEVQWFATWVLVAIFLSILVLIAGVILLSTKKPEKARSTARGPGGAGGGGVSAAERDRHRARIRSVAGAGRTGEESVALRSGEAGHGEGEGEGEVMWELGSVSDDDEDVPKSTKDNSESKGRGNGHSVEGGGLLGGDEREEDALSGVGSGEAGLGEGRSVRALSIRTERSADARSVDMSGFERRGVSAGGLGVEEGNVWAQTRSGEEEGEFGEFTGGG